MYADLLANWFSGGSISSRNKLSAVGIKTIYDRFLTREYIVKVWAVEGLPVTFDYYLTDLIRGHMRKVCPDVKIVINTYSEPSNLKASNEQFKRQLGRAAEMYHKYEMIFGSLREDEQLTGKVFKLGRGSTWSVSRKQFDKTKDCYQSYRYVYERLLSGSGIYQTAYFVQAYARNNKGIIEFKRELESLFDDNKIIFREIKGNVSAYLKIYGVAGFPEPGKMKLNKMLCSDENLTTFIPTSTVGLLNKNGILMGVDVKNEMPVLINYFESGAGQTLMFLGKTGTGKTLCAFMFAINLIAQGHHCSVIDIKGNEWNRMLNFVDGTVISFDDLHPVFVNTLRIDDIEVDSNTCSYYYRNAITGTVQLLSIMTSLSPNEGNQVDLDMLLEDTVVKLFAKHGVLEDVPESFKNSAHLNYREILEILEVLATSKSYSTQQIELIKLIKTRCGMYLESDGRYAKAFKNEITLGEVLDSELVVYSFNKNSNTMVDRLDAIRIFMAQFLDGKKHFYRKQQKLQSICFFEELQRCIDIPELIRVIAHKVTGGRSDNVTSCILLNSLSTLDHVLLKDIRSNITTYIVGLLNTQDITLLVDEYGFRQERERLEELGDDNYRNCFYLKFDTGLRKDSCTMRCLIPNEILQILNTRDRADTK